MVQRAVQQISLAWRQPASASTGTSITLLQYFSSTGVRTTEKLPAKWWDMECVCESICSFINTNVHFLSYNAHYQEQTSPKWRIYNDFLFLSWIKQICNTRCLLKFACYLPLKLACCSLLFFSCHTNYKIYLNFSGLY